VTIPTDNYSTFKIEQFIFVQITIMTATTMSTMLVALVIATIYLVGTMGEEEKVSSR
jgi:hypothetical protein